MATKSPRKPRKTTSAKKGTAQPSEIAPNGQAGSAAEVPGNEFQRAQHRIEEEIRVRAYAFFEERGRQEGHHHEDWVRAETEILAKYQRPKSA